MRYEVSSYLLLRNRRHRNQSNILLFSDRLLILFLQSLKQNSCTSYHSSDPCPLNPCHIAFQKYCHRYYQVLLLLRYRPTRLHLKVPQQQTTEDISTHTSACHTHPSTSLPPRGIF